MDFPEAMLDGLQEEDDILLLACGILLQSVLMIALMNEERPVRRWWVDPMFSDRNTAGEYVSWFRKIYSRNHDRFFEYTRMEVWQYDELFRLTNPYLLKRSRRKAVSPDMRLAITIKYFAHGGAIKSLAWSYRIGRTTVRKIIWETSLAIWRALHDYVKVPSTEEEWNTISKDFWEMWNFPNTVGAIDGKHIGINCPPSAGSEFYNYKHFHSIVLLAACDAQYRFVWVDVGHEGSSSDGGVIQSSSFGAKIIRGEVPLPSKPLPGREAPDYPCWFLGDAAFPLKKNILKPYPGHSLGQACDVFNYRLSRARRVIENAFGILVARWRVLSVKLNGSPKMASAVVLACVALHNFLMKTKIRSESRYCHPTFVDQEDDGCVVPGQWRNEIQNVPHRNLGRIGSNNPRRSEIEMRNEIRSFLLSSDGSVPWQLRVVNRGRSLY